MIDPAFAWAAFLRRDRSFDGQFIGAVKTTKIYCKPSCPVRHPKPQNGRLSERKPPVATRLP